VFRWVFGPVASRRLGRSLGVDPLPFKTCHWNCVYCQLGRTAPLRHQRRPYSPPGEVVAEVHAALERHVGCLDFVTFAGSGEPTLHSDLGWMIRRVRELTPLPVAVLTSGALLHRGEVRRELAAADVVMPSLDAGTERAYRAVNRPWPGLTFPQLAAGLVAFRAEYRGRLWVEVMLVRGCNDSDEELAAIAAVLRRVRPDRVSLNVPVRPPAEAWVEAPEAERLALAAQVLGAEVDPPAGGPIEADASPAHHIDVILRHPLPENALSPADADGRVRLVTRGGARFWAPADGRYA
jgi:wyosine [tRNA(Phe)-imidazoG37] synthetase (radical SAM superfamily)